MCVSSGHRLTATAIDVPADNSSAAFFMVGASIAEGSDLTLEHVGINPTRIGVINILRLMGANIDILREREIGGEPVADRRRDAVVGDARVANGTDRRRLERRRDGAKSGALDLALGGSGVEHDWPFRQDEWRLAMSKRLGSRDVPVR